MHWEKTCLASQQVQGVLPHITWAHMLQNRQADTLLRSTQIVRRQTRCTTNMLRVVSNKMSCTALIVHGPYLCSASLCCVQLDWMLAHAEANYHTMILTVRHFVINILIMLAHAETKYHVMILTFNYYTIHTCIFIIYYISHTYIFIT